MLIIVVVALIITLVVYFTTQTPATNTEQITRITRATSAPLSTPTGISPDFLNTLGAIPNNVLNYFVQNYSNIDLSTFGISGPGNGSSTRGPLSNLNVLGEVSGTFSVPIEGKIDYVVSSLQGLQNATFSVPQINTFAYGTINPVSAKWSSDLSTLHVNTTIAVTIPQLKAQISVAGCGSGTLTLDNVVVALDLGIDYIPGLNLIKNIALEINPLKFPANQTTGPIPMLQITADNPELACSTPIIGPIVASLVNTAFVGTLNNTIQGTVPNMLDKLINEAFSKYNSTIGQFITQSNIVDANTNVLVTDWKQLAQLFVDFLTAIGTDPGVIYTINTDINQGLSELQLLFQWATVSYSCAQELYTTNSATTFPYNTGQIQAYVAPVTAPTGAVQDRKALLATCMAKQSFDCNVQSNGCVATPNGRFVFDPANGDLTPLYNCGDSCVQYACRMADGACVKAYTCVGQGGGNACYPGAYSTNVCSNQCPSYIYADGVCGLAPPGQGKYFNDPTCGGQVQPNVNGVCIVSPVVGAAQYLCYSKFPFDGDSKYSYQSVMTSDACNHLADVMAAAGTSWPVQWQPGGTCTTALCSSTIPGISGNCSGSTIPCSSQPYSSDGAFNGWDQAACAIKA